MNVEEKNEPSTPDESAAVSGERSVGGSWSRGGGLLFGLLLLAAVIFIAANIGEGRKFAELVQKAEPFWLLVGLGCQALTYLCAAGVWHIVLSRFGIKIRLGSLVSLALAKLSIDKIIPAAGIGGGVLLVRGLVKRGTPGPVATASLLLDLLSVYAARSIAVGITIIILWVNQGFQTVVLVLVTAYALITLSISIAILWLTQPERRYIPQWATKLPGLKRVLGYIADAPPEAMRNKKLFWKATLLQFAIIVLDAATLDAMLRAIGQPSHADHVFASFSMALIASTLSLIPGGLGAFEAVSVLMLRLLNIPIEAGLAATLMLRAFTLWLPMVPGFFILHRERAITRQKHDR